MIILVFVIVFIAVFNYLINNRVKIHFATFLKRGFKKKDDDYGLYLFYAIQGGGKTFSVVDILSHYVGHKKIYTNVRSFYEKFKDYVTFEDDFEKLVKTLETVGDCSEVVVFYDEVFSLFDESGYMPELLRNFFTQMRKRHLTFFTSSQLWTELPSAFRRLCRYEVSCRIISPWYLPFSILINEFNDASNIKWDKDSQSFLCPRLWTSIKKCNRAIAESYDTYETIKHVTTFKRTRASNAARPGNKKIRRDYNELF